MKCQEVREVGRKGRPLTEEVPGEGITECLSGGIIFLAGRRVRAKASGCG